MPPIFGNQQHVVITGGDGALGAAVVEAFVEAGATCHLPVIADPPPARPQVIAAARIDLTNEHHVAGYFAALPPIAASIHLAGGFTATPIADTSLRDFEQQLRINAVTTFLCCREAIRRMRDAGGGRIVNVAARAVLQPPPGMAAYVTSKSAVAALTQALGAEVHGDGILVNAVLPSIIDTPANRRAMPKADYTSWPKPEEIARAILALASPDNRLTWGALVPVYGDG